MLTHAMRVTTINSVEVLCALLCVATGAGAAFESHRKMKNHFRTRFWCSGFGLTPLTKLPMEITVISVRAHPTSTREPGLTSCCCWARSQGGARARGGGEIEIQFTKFERAEPGKMEMKPSRRFGARGETRKRNGKTTN